MRLRALIFASIAAAPISAPAAQAQPDNAAIRAGHNIAVTSCIACHVVSPTQNLKPVLGPDIPSFQEIADRPGITIASLGEAMKVARWHDPGLAATLLPMSRLSDTQRAQVASYILSLRKKD